MQGDLPTCPEGWGQFIDAQMEGLSGEDRERSRVSDLLQTAKLACVQRLVGDDWKSLTRLRIERDFMEVERQAHLIRDELKRLERDRSMEARIKRALFNWYARDLLFFYVNPPPSKLTGMGFHHRSFEPVPEVLYQIIAAGFPAGDELRAALGKKERAPKAKQIALTIVQHKPTISQRKLIRESGATPQTIKKMKPILIAAGWRGLGTAASSKRPATGQRQRRPGIVTTRLGVSLPAMSWEDEGG